MSVSISRPTGGGTITFHDRPDQERCALCDRDETMPFGLVVVVDNGPTLRVSVCGQCVATALALYFGRKHLEAGGELEELSYEIAARATGHKPRSDA